VLREQPKRPLGLDDIARPRTVSDPRVSPNGKWVAYVVGTLEAEKDLDKLAIVPAAGGAAKVLTTAMDRPVNGYILWSPDGQSLRVVVEDDRADRIKTPTLFMSGDKDFNVLTAGVEQMYQALKSLNVGDRAGDLPRPAPRPDDAELPARPPLAVAGVV
jgi:dipeptidyl aminopeptidase/acylaminoacyl peptidase